MAWAPIIAAAIPAIMSYMENKNGKNDAQKGSTYTPGQQSFLENLLKDLQGMGNNGGRDISQNQGYQQGQEYLNSLFNDPEFFNKFEAPIKRQFNEEVIPDLANRFAGMGSGGSTNSSAFRNQLAREGSNLSTNLAALRGGMQQQGVGQQLGYAQQPFQNYMQMLQSALTPTQNVYQPPSAGFWGPIAAQGIGAISQGYGQQMGRQMAGTGQPPAGY
jgi:hypothetical protein